MAEVRTPPLFICAEGMAKSRDLALQFGGNYLSNGFRPLLQEYWKLQKKQITEDQFQAQVNKYKLPKDKEIVVVLEDEDQSFVSEGFINYLIAIGYDITVVFQNNMFEHNYVGPEWEKKKKKLKADWVRFHS